MEQLSKTNFRVKRLYQGCMLASIAHAIIVTKYPNMSYEQSWDGINYSIQDSSGQRGTITFDDEFCVAAFRNDSSERIAENLNSLDYFANAPFGVIELANSETLQYLLEEVGEITKPIITTAFWGSDIIYSNDNIKVIMSNGANIIKNQLLDTEDALRAWQEEYEMNKEQIELLRSIYNRKIDNVNSKIVLSKDESKKLQAYNRDGGFEESKISFSEMGIILN